MYRGCLFARWLVEIVIYTLPELPNWELKLEKWWNCLTKRPRAVQTPGDAMLSNSVPRHLQNNSESVTFL